MWIVAPQEIVNVGWSGPLEHQDSQATGPNRGDQTTSITGVDLPIVEIGLPEVWPLPKLYTADKLDRRVNALIADWDFYLVRFSCSFRYRSREMNIDWARFSVTLTGENDQQTAIAYDIHPVSVVQTSQRDLKVALNPTLKFQEIEGSLASLETGITYTIVEPRISGSGIGGPIPSWDYNLVRGHTIEGAKIMHILLKTPKDQNVYAETQIEADIRIKQNIFGTIFNPSKIEHTALRKYSLINPSK